MKLFLLVCGHYLGDFALQNDFVAKFKKRGSAPFWYHVLIAHACIHGGIVALITGNIWLGIAEVFCHALIDFLKCEEKLSFDSDQFLHLSLKLIYFLK